MTAILHDLWRRFTGPYASAVQACGALAMVAVGVEAEFAPARPLLAAAPPPSVFQSVSPFTAGGLFTWIVIGGGAPWAIRQLGELIFAIKSGWRKADAGTDHERWENCEKGRMNDAATIDGLRKQLDFVNGLVHDKDAQLTASAAREREKDAAIEAMNARLMAMNSRLLDHVVTQSAPPPMVKIDQSGGPVEVHEVGGAARA